MRNEPALISDTWQLEIQVPANTYPEFVVKFTEEAGVTYERSVGFYTTTNDTVNEWAGFLNGYNSRSENANVHYLRPGSEVTWVWRSGETIKRSLWVRSQYVDGDNHFQKSIGIIDTTGTDGSSYILLFDASLPITTNSNFLRVQVNFIPI
jgi:hypothetical protein